MMDESVLIKDLVGLENELRKKKKCKKLTRSEIMNKKLEYFSPELSSKKPLSNFLRSGTMFSSAGDHLKGMKDSFRNKKHEKMCLITFLSFFLYLAFPSSFLYSKISKTMVIFTAYLWLMTIWFYFLVRRQDPGIVPRLELLEGIRRVWTWRFQEKIQLIEGFDLEESASKTTESQRELCGESSRTENTLMKEEVLFKTNIAKLEIEDLNMDFAQNLDNPNPLKNGQIDLDV